MMSNVKECWSNRKTGKKRIFNVIGILSFFLLGARVIDPGLQEKGEFTEICVEFLQNVLNHNPKRNPKRTKRT